jgi:hypothetical protein
MKINRFNLFDISFDILKEPSEVLNDFIIEGRYPTDIPLESITVTTAHQALEALNQISTFVLKKLPR